MAAADINTVIAEHGPALLAYATKLTGGDRHQAEDVLQETWIRAWRRADRLNEEYGSIRAWLRRIAHNVAVDQHRSRRARPTEVSLPDSALHNSAMIGDPAGEVDVRLDMVAVLDSLSPVHRGTVVQVYFADQTAVMAADSLGVPVGTVKSRIHNALNALRGTMLPQAA